MVDTNISFYLKSCRIHVFVESLRLIGSPKRICFLMNKEGTKLMLVPYAKRDFISHSVPEKVYHSFDTMEVCSQKLCTLVASLYHWDITRSYRVPGKVVSEKGIVVFDLTKAVLIKHRKYKECC